MHERSGRQWTHELTPRAGGDDRSPTNHGWLLLMLMAAALMGLLAGAARRPALEEAVITVPEASAPEHGSEHPDGGGAVAAQDPPDPHEAMPHGADSAAGAEPFAASQPPAERPSTSGRFLETFDADPAKPQPWDPPNWDVVVHSRDISTWRALESIDAAHGHDCGPPPATHGVSAYEDAVFSCRDHVMTSINAGGYGAIYLTPDHLVDFSQGEAVVRVDVSTLRASGRDWWDLWLTPYADNLQAPLESWFPDLAGPPKNALQISLNESNAFIPRVYRDHREQTIDSDWSRRFDDVLTPDAKRRDTFELRVSRTHVTFGMPDYDYWPIDTDIDDLGWDTAVVQFGHHSYNPTKDGRGGHPGTWHWDNVEIAPAVPFTILGADRRYVDPATTGTVTFDAPAPTDAHLRFSGMGERFDVSYDGGVTWERAQTPPQITSNGLLFSNYWTPIPEGAQQVVVRGHTGWLTSWIAKDFAVWSHAAPQLQEETTP